MRAKDIAQALLMQERANIRALEAKVSAPTQVVTRAETAGAVTRYATLADAPLAAVGNMTNGDLAWVNNGRKPSEGPGLGTGVLAIYNAALDRWDRANDYTAVTV